MRPGRKGPGNPDPALGGGQVFLEHSMRPGRKGPGNRPARLPSNGTRDIFNEAGAQRPRKPGSRRARWRGGPKIFNEAGAQRPRKPVGAVRVVLVKSASSMRPGRKGPGNLLLARRPESPLQSSMRPGRKGPGNRRVSRRSGRVTAPVFNEAGAQRPRKPVGVAGPGARKYRLQ